MSLYIVDYTEKAIAIFGETKNYKNKLAEVGGKYNGSLNYQNEKIAGWIFPKSKRSMVEQLVDDINKGRIPKEQTLSYKEPVVSSVQQVSTNEYKNEDSNNSRNNSLNLSHIKDELTTLFVSKKDFMNLVSKIERLEQEVAILKGSPVQEQTKTPSNKKYNGMVKLNASPKNWADAEDNDEDYEEEDEPTEKNTKSLLRGTKK